MDSKLLTKYYNRLSQEIKDLFLGLSDPENISMLIALDDYEKLSFDEIKQKFDLNPDDLTQKLYMLQNANLIKNFYDKSDENTPSYYCVTDLFEQILDSIHDSLYNLPVKRSDQNPPPKETNI